MAPPYQSWILTIFTEGDESRLVLTPPVGNLGGVLFIAVGAKETITLGRGNLAQMETLQTQLSHASWDEIAALIMEAQL